MDDSQGMVIAKLAKKHDERIQELEAELQEARKSAAASQDAHARNLAEWMEERRKLRAVKHAAAALESACHADYARALRALPPAGPATYREIQDAARAAGDASWSAESGRTRRL